MTSRRAESGKFADIHMTDSDSRSDDSGHKLSRIVDATAPRSCRSKAGLPPRGI